MNVNREKTAQPRDASPEKNKQRHTNEKPNQQEVWHSPKKRDIIGICSWNDNLTAVNSVDKRKTSKMLLISAVLHVSHKVPMVTVYLIVNFIFI